MLIGPIILACGIGMELSPNATVQRIGASIILFLGMVGMIAAALFGLTLLAFVICMAARA
jgi:hypothetical protein